MMDAFFLIGAAQGLGVYIKSYFFLSFLWTMFLHLSGLG